MFIRCAVISWDWDKGPDAEDLRKFCENQPKLFNGRSAPVLTHVSDGDNVLIASAEPVSAEQALKVARTYAYLAGVRPGDIAEIKI